MTDGPRRDVEFFKTHDVIGEDDIRKLNNDRELFVEQFENGCISQDECVKQITVESNLLEICKRKIRIGQRSNAQQMEVDDESIVTADTLAILSNRINHLYYSMFQLFPVQVTSLTEYMTFFFSNKQFITVNSDLLSTILSRNHSDPEVYIAAATFVYTNTSDIEAARRYFADGLKYHKCYKNLYTKEFWVETQHIEDSGGASMPIALKKYKNILQCFKGDMEFHFILLDYATRFSTVWELQYHVIRDMVEKYRNSELMWRKLASINLDGFIYEHESKSLSFDWHCKRRLEHCFKAYEDGLKDNLPPKKRYKLWNFYIDHVIEIWKAYGIENKAIQSFVNEAMEKVFQEAYDNGVLNKAEHYVYWAEYSYEERSEILNKAIEMNKHNPNIWTELLKLYADHDSYAMVKKVFEDGVRSLENNSLLLWEMMNLYMKNKDQKLVVEFYNNGINYPCEEINLKLKLHYLQWFKEYNGLSATRKLFKELNNSGPICVELYMLMISFEKSFNAPDVTSISDLYSDACTRFGQKDVKLWTDRIRFAYTYGEQSNARQIYKTSLSILDSELLAVLENEFGNIKDEFTFEQRKMKPSCKSSGH